MQVDNLSIDTPDLSLPGREADRSRQFIDAANELLSEGGLEGLTVRAVLNRTGLARRAFYDRFVGKDDLVLAVFEKALLTAAQQFRSQVAALATPIEKIRMVVVGLVTGAIDNDVEELSDQWVVAIVREHLRLAQTRPDELEAAIAPLLDLIAELVTDGIRKGQLRDCDPALQAALIYNLVATTLHTELMLKETVGAGSRARQFMADEIWEFCRRAIIA